MLTTLGFTCSCSFLNSNPSAPLNLQSASADWAPYSVGEDGTYVYKSSGNFKEPLFLTGIKKCDGQQILGKTSRSLARQLFVGLKNIRILSSKEELVEGHSVALSRVTGDFEGEPLDFAHYMTTEDDCLIDIVTWTKGSTSNKQETDYIYLTQAELQQFLDFIKSRGSLS